jgi:hypothetical protein
MKISGDQRYVTISNLSRKMAVNKRTGERLL